MLTTLQERFKERQTIDSHPKLSVLQLFRRDSCPAVEFKAGDEVLTGVEQEVHALHGEVLALGALEVPQLTQAEEVGINR